MKVSDLKTLIGEMTKTSPAELKTVADVEKAIIKVMEYTKKKKYLAKK